MFRTFMLGALLALVAAGCRSPSDTDAHSAPTPHAAAQAVSKPAAPALNVRAAKVGEAAPNFTLKDLNGKVHMLAQYKGKTVVLEWFNPGCPYCEYGYGDGTLKTMPEAYEKAGVVWLSINSEDGKLETAGAEVNRAFVEKHGMKAPLLMDPTGVVGMSYGAKATPHMFVIDPKGVLVYQGALDNAPLGKTADGVAMIDYVGDAVAAVKAGRAVKTPETKAYG
ncbi:MAG: redoxin domain-containing protein [Planctomycetota bacterium]|nr:redoxin domain-containing protein [Planctomycetota bacterium]